MSSRPVGDDGDLTLRASYPVQEGPLSYALSSTIVGCIRMCVAVAAVISDHVGRDDGHPAATPNCAGLDVSGVDLQLYQRSR